MYFLKLKSDPLAVDELKSLCKIYEVKFIKHLDKERIVIINKKFPFSRLTLTHYVAKYNKLGDNIHYNDYRVVGRRELELSLPKKIGGKVKLSNPKLIIRAEKVNDEIIFGKEIWKFKKLEREYSVKEHITMNAELSRLLVNLCGIKEKEKVYDPFCGTGSILIEAGLMGIEILGSDIDNKMVSRASENLDKFKIKGEIFESDFFKTKIKVNSIVTDLPYGRGTKNIKEDFPEMFSKKLFESLKKNGSAVIVFHKEIESKYFIPEKVFKVKVHRSLNRYIHIFRKK